MKDFFTNFLKQVLLFKICGFKNCKIESEVVPIWVGHSVYNDLHVIHCCTSSSAAEKKERNRIMNLSYNIVGSIDYRYIYNSGFRTSNVCKKIGGIVFVFNRGSKQEKLG